MPESWANFGLDLHLALDQAQTGGDPGGGERTERGDPAGGGTGVRARLEAALRGAIRSGRLGPGTRLPASRHLARDLGVARNTVAEAYGQLVAEGWLSARTGAGTWVARRPDPGDPGPGAGIQPGPVQPGPVQPGPVQPGPVPAGIPRYDLRPGVPDLSAFPRREWTAAARAALAGASDDVLGRPDPQGLPVLRSALAGYLARARGVTASPDRIVVCAGFTQGLALLCRVLRDQGAVALAAEAFGLPDYRWIASSCGLATVTLPVDAGGAVVSSLTGGGPAAGAVLVTPAHQFPLGVTLAPERRMALVSWAARTGGLVIEDDYDGEFRYDRQPVGAMQPLAPDRVVYAGTASKSLAPGLRLGWLVLPAGMVDQLVTAREAAGAISGALDQLTLARLITTGGYDRQIRQRRLAYRRRRDRLVAALGGLHPQVRLTGIAAGLHVVAELPAGLTEASAIASAARHGVVVTGLASYAVPGQTHRPALIIGYGRPPDQAYTSAVARLRAALAEFF